MKIVKEERNLSPAETQIMKAIWDHTKDKKEGIPVSSLAELLRTDYGKDYAKTTIDAFLLHLSDKCFATTYRQGRFSFVVPLKSEQEYREKLLLEFCEFWFNGNVTAMIRNQNNARKFTKEEIKEMREMLDALPVEG